MDWANTISLDLEFPVTPSQTIDTVALGTLVDQAVATEAGTEFSVQQQSDPWQQDSTTVVVPFNITTTLDDAAILQAAENLGSVQFSVSLSRRSTVSGYTYVAQVRIVTHCCYHCMTGGVRLQKVELGLCSDCVDTTTAAPTTAAPTSGSSTDDPSSTTTTTVSQAVTVSATLDSSSYSGSLKVNYENGYGIAAGACTSPCASYNTGISVGSLITGRRATTITFTITLSGVSDTAAYTSGCSGSCNPSTLAAAISTATGTTVSVSAISTATVTTSGGGSTSSSDADGFVGSIGFILLIAVQLPLCVSVSAPD